MTVTPTYPGVYIEELPSGVHTITPVSTSITAFVGYTPRGPIETPVTLTSFADFERSFSGLSSDSVLSYTVQHFFLNGGSVAIVVRLASGYKQSTGTIPAGGSTALTVTAVNPDTWSDTLRVAIDDNTPTAGNNINVGDTVGTLLNKIGAITGVAPTISASGAITLHTGTAQNLNITTSSAAFSALGFTSPVNVARNGGGTAGTGVVIGNDQTAFTNESISGGAVTAYNASGTPVNLQLRWAKTDSSSLGAGHQDVWNLFYQTSTTATGVQTAWVNSGTNFIFGANGALTSPTGSAISIPGVTVDGQSLGTLAIDANSGALTQFASSSGAATINTISQNGFAAGQLQSVAINNSGIVVGTFSNGQNIDLAAVTLSHFNGTNYLKALDGGAYEVTDLSGAAILGASGTISGSSLEGSNTDIADEFTKLIVTQQAYSANTKVITTANNMVQDLLNVLR